MLPSFLFTLGISLFTYGLVGGGLYFPIIGSGLTDQFRGTAVIASICLVTSFLLARTLPPISWNLAVVSPLLLLLSHNQFSGKTFFSHYFNFNELLLSFALILLLNPKLVRFCKLFVLLTLVGCCINFYNYLGSSLIFSDDLPSFLYRAHVFNSSNPLFPSYDPRWNLGSLWTDIYATASAVPSLVILSLSFLGLETGFNTTVFILNFLLGPMVVYLSCRILRLSRSTTWLAVVLAQVSSTLIYRWGLKYGALGYLATSNFAILSGIIIVKSIEKGHLSLAERWLLYISITIAAFWPLNLLCFAVPAFQHFLRSSNKDRVLIMLSVGLPLIFVLHGLTYSEHFRTWISGEPSFDRASSKDIFRNSTLALNPIVLFLLPFSVGIGRRGLQTLILNYLVVGVAIGVFFEKLELHRVIGQLAVVGSIPISMILSAVWQNLHSVSRAFVLSLIAVSCLQIVYLAGNQSFEKFSILEKPFKRFIEWSKEQPNARFFFTGHILHQFSGGHIAPLPLLTHNEFVAMWPTHRSWTPQDPVPRSIQNSTTKLHYFFRALCPDYLIADKRFWKRRLNRLKKNGGYRRVFHFDQFSVYQFFDQCTYPKSNVKSHLNKIIISNPQLQSSFILPYRFFEGLRVKGCKTISGVKISNFDFIKLSGCKSESIVVRPFGQLSDND